MKKLTYSFILLIVSLISQAQTITWAPAMNVAASSYDNLHPRIVTDRSGDPLIIWGRGSDESVFFSKWNGTGFTMPVKYFYCACCNSNSSKGFKPFVLRIRQFFLSSFR